MRHVVVVAGWRYTIRPSSDEPDADFAPEFLDRAAARAFVRRAAADRTNIRSIREALRDHGRFESLHRRDDAEVLRLAADEIAAGRLLVGWDVPQRPVAAGTRREEPGVEPGPVTPVDGPEEPELTWVGIELVDQGDAPVPAVEFRLDIPDGGVRTGSTGDDGRATERGIDPGTCVAAFPGLVASDLEFLESVDE